MGIIEFYIIPVLCLVVGGVFGLIIAKFIISIFRSIVRASDKSRMRHLMSREAYLNDLYDECLYEEQDKLARKAAKQMSRYNNNNNY